MSEHAFSATEWLKARGLLDKRPIEIGGRVFQARPAVGAAEHLRAFACLNENDYKGFFAIMLDSEEAAAEAVDLIQVPLRQVDENAFWRALVTGLAGREPGESSAS